ncbi:BrnA antitoxin family protein [Mesorhizobium sp. LHD-90]|uniref:BrnA antitoxin family protein n=1 Tax=Mesorhizobium sp. LHD-90 TaxID=3071414 RepID=UPI0027E047DC|nr:BrnA antitoxin family protein [Mesorhizobium sp. LHD-90]MDQ6432789.1 BrnA antitoxin family protein [Mesorhizobium sp. LHD-90]
MASPTRRPGDPFKAAEAVFKRTAKPATEAPRARQFSAAARETVTLKLDRDVLDHFQADGPGWQERINAALREAAGIGGLGETGKRPEELDASNDD